MGWSASATSALARLPGDGRRGAAGAGGRSIHAAIALDHGDDGGALLAAQRARPADGAPPKPAAPGGDGRPLPIAAPYIPAMRLWTELARSLRRVAWKAGLIADPTASAARHVERVLDTRGRELFAQSGVPGLVVSVRFGAGRTISRCLGTAGAATPLRTDTVFPALSMTKPVTAMCVMALVERGVLALDAPVWRHVLDYRIPAHATGGFDPDGITLRGVLSHSSGIRLHGHGWVGAAGLRSPKALLEDESQEAHTLRVVDPPGRTLRYSGGGYLLAQMAVEGATGRPFADVARELVLRPLGMASSDYELSPELAARLATSHDRENRPLPARRLLATAAAGLYSTAEDLTAFWGALAPGPEGEPPGRRVISPDACREMLTPTIVAPDGTTCGIGFYLHRTRTELRYTHLGYFSGWSHHAVGLLRRRVVVTALSNGDRGKECVPPLVHELRRTLAEKAL